MRNRCWPFVLCRLLCGCTSQPRNYLVFVNAQLQEHYSQQSNEYRYIVIIPRTGCHSCVEKADQFFQEYKSSKDYLFIFTRLLSVKRLKIEVGSDNLGQGNVIIDKDDVFSTLQFPDSDYPILLEKNDDGRFSCRYLNDIIEYD